MTWQVCCNMMAWYGITVKWNFFQIWAEHEKSLVKWAPVSEYSKTYFACNMSKLWCVIFLHMENWRYPFWISLTHWGRVMNICVGKLTIIGSDNGLSPGRRQAIIWTNAGILLFWTLDNNFQWNFDCNSNILIQENAIENVCEMASNLSWSQCVNTLRPRQNGRHFPDDIFICIFLTEIVIISI